jgi:hypothetical protein
VPVVNFQEVNVTETLNHYTLYTIFHTEMDWNTVLPCVALCERKAFAPAVSQAGREGRLGGCFVRPAPRDATFWVRGRPLASPS